MISVLDIFCIGIGPSSSHTVGPMRIAKRYLERIERLELTESVANFKVLFRGSLAFTGHGHGTPRAALLGLLGFDPDTIDMAKADAATDAVHKSKTLKYAGRNVSFDPDTDVIFDYDTRAELHPNEMVMQAFDSGGTQIDSRIYYSTGGGFIASVEQLTNPPEDDLIPTKDVVKYPFGSAEDLLGHCDREFKSIADIMTANELSRYTQHQIDMQLDRVCDVMLQCIDRGLNTPGTLPGGLDVSRRAPKLWADLQGNPNANEREVLFDWLNVYAMAVNEENAAGGRVVTAPTNGAAGITLLLLRR